MYESKGIEMYMSLALKCITKLNKPVEELEMYNSKGIEMYMSLSLKYLRSYSGYTRRKKILTFFYNDKAFCSLDYKICHM